MWELVPQFGIEHRYLHLRLITGPTGENLLKLLGSIMGDRTLLRPPKRNHVCFTPPVGKMWFIDQDTLNYIKHGAYLLCVSSIV